MSGTYNLFDSPDGWGSGGTVSSRKPRVLIVTQDADGWIPLGKTSNDAALMEYCANWDGGALTEKSMKPVAVKTAEGTIAAVAERIGNGVAFKEPRSGRIVPWADAVAWRIPDEEPKVSDMFPVDAPRRETVTWENLPRLREELDWKFVVSPDGTMVGIAPEGSSSVAYPDDEISWECWGVSQNLTEIGTVPKILPHEFDLH